MINAILFALLLALGGQALRQNPAAVPGALRDAGRQLLALAIRIPLALVTAVSVEQLIPPNAIAPLIGTESGIPGLILATLFGAVLPGGPIVTFPVALVIWRAGAGDAQMIALVNSWSVFAVHRVVSYEMPLLGPRWVGLRFASSWPLPLLTALLGLIVIPLTGVGAVLAPAP